MSIDVKFWGVRGSRPVPNRAMLTFGGNTPCVSVEIDQTVIIIDAGSGLYDLGQYLLEHRKSIGHIFISHVHWDHIQGLPFFAPFYKEGNSFTLYGEKKKHQSFKTQVSNLMKDPHFPINLNYIKRQLNIQEITANATVNITDEISVHSVASYHPNGALGFAILYKGVKICYLCDYEHKKPIPMALIQWASQADLLIYDANYTDEEYLGKIGWGHSTWQEGVAFALGCKAKCVALFHHDPERTDEALERLEAAAQARFPSAFFAREGQVVSF